MEGIRERLVEIIAPVVEREGYELVDLKVGRQGARALVRVFADRRGGITVGQCADLSRAIADRLDLDDPLAEGYVLEVSSPGLDRPLETAADFRRKVGERVRLTIAAADRPIILEGALTKSSDEVAELLVDGEPVVVELARITRAQVIV